MDNKQIAYLSLLYDESGGDELSLFNYRDLGNKLGFDEKTTNVVIQYLIGAGLIKFQTLNGLGITHRGIKEIEKRRLIENTYNYSNRNFEPKKW